MQGRILGSIIFLATVLPSLSIVVKDHQQVQRDSPRIETCSPLKNHQTYSSVEVAVGNPPQYFNLVADTGSNSCIVKDCGCKQCPKAWGNCFTGPKQSKSFDLPLFKVMNSSKSQNLKQGDMAPAAIVMSFGSGQIAAQIASDEVRIGEVKTYMEKGLLLMVNHALNLEGPFEGILGLGRPEVKESQENLTSEDPSSMVTVPGFFDNAHVQRFSMCFNHQADGVLGVNTPKQLNRMSSVGKLHWGLDFQGVSIGNKKMKVGFCDPSTKKPGMETACGIIPDSGTTLIAGSEKHVGELFEAVCESWERCLTMHHELLKELKMMEHAGITISGGSESSPFGLIHEDPEFLSTLVKRRFEEGSSKPLHQGSGVVKMEFSKQIPGDQSVPKSGQKGFELPPALTLQLLLEHCSGWIKEVDLNKEMPELNFHVAGANGKTKELVITPRNYVLAKAMDVEVPSVSNVYGIPLKTKKIQNQKVCMMAFSPTEFTTELNGDVWIMGTPLFYEYSAHYDRGDGIEKEVTMGFTHRSQEDCGRCQGHKIVRSHSLIWSDSTRTNSSTSSGTGMDALKTLDKQPFTRKPFSRKSL